MHVTSIRISEALHLMQAFSMSTHVSVSFVDIPFVTSCSECNHNLHVTLNAYSFTCIWFSSFSCLFLFLISLFSSSFFPFLFLLLNQYEQININNKQTNEETNVSGAHYWVAKEFYPLFIDPNASAFSRCIIESIVGTRQLINGVIISTTLISTSSFCLA